MHAWRRKPVVENKRVAATCSGVVWPWFCRPTSAIEWFKTLVAYGVNVCWIVDENRYYPNGFNNEFLFQEERSALYHGKPQYYYDVPTQTEECEYDGDGDGEQKSNTENSLYEESDHDDDTSDFDTDSYLYDEDNDAMLEDDNFNDNAHAPKSFIGCNKQKKKKKKAQLGNRYTEGHGCRYKEFNVDTDMESPQFDVRMKFPSKKVLM
ncbi:hypothetical protein D8674_030433 [Pyrus ussuriensis x Pyrus communis]|uniref:Uncharacterized protein n=1 Tax=Pyrus ussuriensis x Pyrus communis TaxID=2448454 RepID=A0A5N5EWR9_9ROSA|nr:hypothetical protein D8674_030433 [Pyrus ussuriensis x Pyrus communis]